MVESLMSGAIGFLAATLISVFIIPQVHARAVRLTDRRIQAANPLVTEILAAKDQQRAEFAISTCRLELTIRRQKERVTGLLAAIGNRNDKINRLTVELSDHAAAIVALRQALREVLDATKDSVPGKLNDDEQLSRLPVQRHLMLVSDRTKESA